ncbi:hypothetical protein HaLaN_20358, partial [Haematococcus lacustris]
MMMNDEGGQLALPSFTTVLRRLANLWSRSPEDIKAKDADSLDPEAGVKKEGAFYTWTEE